MSDTLATIRTNVQINLFEDVSSGFWTTAQLNDFINRATLMVAGEVQWELDQNTVSLKTSKTFYLWPSDMLVPLRVRDTTTANGAVNVKIFPTRIEKMEKEMRSWRLVGNGPPSRFSTRGIDYLWIWPPPPPAFANNNMTVDYVPVPASLVNDTDTFDGPKTVIEAVVELATAFALLDKDINAAAKRMDNYAQKLSEARADYGRDNEFHTTKLRPATRYDKAHHTPWMRRTF